MDTMVLTHERIEQTEAGEELDKLVFLYLVQDYEMVFEGSGEDVKLVLQMNRFLRPYSTSLKAVDEVYDRLRERWPLWLWMEWQIDLEKRIHFRWPEAWHIMGDALAVHWCRAALKMQLLIAEAH